MKWKFGGPRFARLANGSEPSGVTVQKGVLNSSFSKIPIPVRAFDGPHLLDLSALENQVW